MVCVSYSLPIFVLLRAAWELHFTTNMFCAKFHYVIDYVLHWWKTACCMYTSDNHTWPTFLDQRGIHCLYPPRPPLCSVVSAPDIPRRRYTSLPLICEVICSEVTLKTLEIVLSSSKCQGQSCWCCMNLRRYYEMVARENPLVWPFKLFEMRNGQFYWTVGCLYTTRKFCLQFSLICENDQSLAKIAQLLHSNTPALTLDN